MEKESNACGVYHNNQFFPSLSDFKFLKEEINHLSLKDQILFNQFGGGTRLKTPFDNVLDAFEHWLHLMPNATALDHLNKKITYKQLDDKATILAISLKQKGIQHGDKIGLYISRSIPMIVSVIAILKLGAAYVPQDARIVPRKMLNQINKICNLKIILTLSKYKTNIPASNNEKVIYVDEELNNPVYKNLYGSIKLIRHKNTFINDVCFILFTSGTTGVPNGVEVTHKNLCNILYNPEGNLGIHPGVKVAQILNISFDMSAWEILGCLGNGGTLLIRGKDINETVRRANIIIATPSILTTINPDDCKKITTVAVAGEPCPLILANAWSKVCDFYNCCGPTETTIVNTMKKYKPNSKELSIGKPTPNNTVYILDSHEKASPIGEVGVMWAGGHCVTKGYINNEQLNSDRYAYDPFIGDGSKMFNTGDLGRWNEQGELVHYGRVDDQVKIKGFRVELDAVSKIIESFPEIKRAATLKHKSRLISFIGAMDTINSIDIERIKKAIEENLPYYYLPSDFVLLEELPKTSRGKIDKKTLKNLIIG